MDKEPIVSVIIPCYNNQDTIIETLESVINQTFKKVEIILVDDGSEQDIQNKVSNFIENRKIIFFKQDNKGVSHARNYGAKHATGDFFVFLDADDILVDTYIEKCVAVFKQDSTIKIVYSQANLFGRENKKWEIPAYENLHSFLIGNCIFVTAMLKKEDFIKANGFDTELDFYEDWDLWISILKNGGNVFQIPETLFLYRTHESLTSTSDKANNLKRIHALNRLKIYLKHYDIYEKEFEHFEEIFLTHIERTHRVKKKKWYSNLKNKIIHKK